MNFKTQASYNFFVVKTRISNIESNWLLSLPALLLFSEELLKPRWSIQVRYIGVSNETSYGVMEFVHASKVEGLPKIVSIQNSYSLLVRCKFESKFFPEISLGQNMEAVRIFLWFKYKKLEKDIVSCLKMIYINHCVTYFFFPGLL